jgi:ABC-type Fe3+/spermidine/putrescine transport system ATPase subunit
VIGGFITPDHGEVFIRNRRVTDLPPYLRNIGVVFQNYALWPHMTVFENLAFGLRLRNMPREEIVKRVDRALELVRLKGLHERYPRELSGGQQQRVAMARALAIDPEVIILDEPLSNLDRRLREEMRIELKRLQRSLGVTMLFVTHDQEEALSMSDQVVVMHGGRIQQMADPRTVYQQPATSFVASFLGNANFLPGKVIEVKDGSTATAHCGAPVSVGQDVSLVVRPEWLAVSTTPAEAADASLRGRVCEVIYEGASIRYGVTLNGESEGDIIFVHTLSSSGNFNPGDEVALNVRSAVIVEGS